MTKRMPHNVVVQKPEGGVAVYPMKQWLRDNPQYIPSGMDVDFNTSHELRKALRNAGWDLQRRADQIHLIKPSNDAGRIDITATDVNSNIVVIELKAGTATPQVIVQILAYMGTIAETENKPVRGILVAGDFHKKVILAARAIPNLQLRKYSFQFMFESVGK